MVLNDAIIFIISLLFMGFYYMIFNSDIFVETALAEPFLSHLNSEGKRVADTAGHLVIMFLIILFYAATYLLLINLV